MTYAVILPQLDRTKSLVDGNYGTISTSLGSPFLGSSDATITLIEFGNYGCQDCKQWFQEIKPQIMKNFIDTGNINMIFIDMEPPDKNALLASEATYCANEQGKYSEYLKTLFNSQQEIDRWAKSEQLKKLAIDIDLDEDLFEKCLDSGKYEKKILSNIDYAKNLGVEKLPIFKIINSNGKEHVLKGIMSSTVFENIVNQFQ